MDNYKPNSYKSKEEETLKEEKKIEKVVTKKVITRKKNGLRKFADLFIAEEVEDVKSYIFLEVLIPSIKKAVSDIVKDGIDMLLNGETNRRKKSGSSKISYIDYYDNDDRRSDRRSSSSRRVSMGFNYDDIIFATSREAEDALIQMDDIISKFKVVCVADLYEMAEIPNDNYTLNNYGWTNLSSARVVPVRGGYIIRLPRAVPLT